LSTSVEKFFFSFLQKLHLFIFRYSREEDFTLLSVDIRHSQNLKESLEQYVIGELLDGPNAYFCEKCNKKV
jgi:ubiquitin carboxyl-terminal hydrolase 9/24